MRAGRVEVWQSSVSALLGADDATREDAVEHALARIDRLNPALGAFTCVMRPAGPPHDGPLRGMPTALKDLTATAGVPTRYGSAAFRDHVPHESDALALAVAQTGAVSLGKTATPEFGLVGFTEPRAFAPARNPWDLATGAGGSSGGAAAAVAAGLVPFAIGSDGGGSVRIPAAMCGVVGLKPSRGLLAADRSRENPLSLSVAGPITRTVDDAALVLEALTGARLPLAAHGSLAAPLRVGVTTATPWDGWTDTTVEPAGMLALSRAADVLADAGHSVRELPWHPRGYADFFPVLWRASAAAIPIPDERLSEVEPATAWLVREGRALSADRQARARAAARQFAADTRRAFAAVDVVLTPALARSPRPIGWFSPDDPALSFEQQCQVAPHTSFVNVAGLPATSVPVVMSREARPWSVQVIGRHLGEAAMLRAARDVERGGEPLPWPALALGAVERLPGPP